MALFYGIFFGSIHQIKELCMARETNSEIKEEVNVFKAFRTHLTYYILINAFFWLIWLANGGMSIYAWPAYPTIIWGIILLIHYISANRAFRHHSKQE